MPVDEPQPLQHEHAAGRPRPSARGHLAIRPARSGSEKPGGDVLALGGEVAGEALELEDVVVDGGRGDEGAESVTARDEPLALQQLERLAEGHQRHAELARELALVVEPLTGASVPVADALAQAPGDLVIAGHSTAGFIRVSSASVF